MKTIAIILTALTLSACATSQAPQYSISTSNNEVLKTIRAGTVNVGLFQASKNFDNACRAGSPELTLPDQLSFEGYIQKALAEEFKVAGLSGDKPSAVTLSGSVEELVFSTTQGAGFSGGSWDIGLHVNSSNGKSTYVSAHYPFASAFNAFAACERAAAAYLPAVQNLIGKLLASPDFITLVTLPPASALKN